MNLSEMIMLWKELNPEKPNLFDGMTLPEGFTQEFLYRMILVEYGEMEVLYKNTKDFYSSVWMFWEKNTPMFNKLMETTEYEYDPLVNVDYRSNRKEFGKNKKGYEDKVKSTNSGTERGDGTDNKTGDTKNYVSAFNQGNGESLKEHSASTDGDVWNENGSWQNSGTKDTTNNYQGEWGTESQFETKGLKGVSNQSLIEEQRKTVMFHVEDVILKYWAEELMVAVW